MTYTCPICNLMPNSHSLIKLLEKQNVMYYYTCPSQALLYYDVEGIIKHYDGVFSAIPEDNDWIWIFDSLGFGFVHALQTNVAIRLAKLISNKFSKNLKKIIIINPIFYVSMTHKLIMPFLNETIKNIIEINYHNTTANEIIL